MHTPVMWHPTIPRTKSEYKYVSKKRSSGAVFYIVSNLNMTMFSPEDVQNSHCSAYACTSRSIPRIAS